MCVGPEREPSDEFLETKQSPCRQFLSQNLQSLCCVDSASFELDFVAPEPTINSGSNRVLHPAAPLQKRPRLGA